jgi:hypothetical protein
MSMLPQHDPEIACKPLGKLKGAVLSRLWFSPLLQHASVLHNKFVHSNPHIKCGFDV